MNHSACREVILAISCELGCRAGGRGAIVPWLRVAYVWNANTDNVAQSAGASRRQVLPSLYDPAQFTFGLAAIIVGGLVVTVCFICQPERTYCGGYSARLASGSCREVAIRLIAPRGSSRCPPVFAPHKVSPLRVAARNDETGTGLLLSVLTASWYHLLMFWYSGDVLLSTAVLGCRIAELPAC
jgi:hypothetical protein